MAQSADWALKILRDWRRAAVANAINYTKLNYDLALGDPMQCGLLVVLDKEDRNDQSSW
jgi:hypothetical protein